MSEEGRLEREREAEIFQLIGEFTFWYSQVELALRMLLARALKLHGKLFEPVTGSYDFRKLCSVTEQAIQVRWPTRAKDFEVLTKRALSINLTRVRIAHGTWAPGGYALSASHMSQTFQIGTYFEDPNVLAAAVEEARKLSHELIMLELLLDEEAKTEKSADYGQDDPPQGL